jgi:hypothetical protein
MGASGRMKQSISVRNHWAGLLLALVVSAPAYAQSLPQGSSMRGFQMVQHVDDVLYGVDALALDIKENRYVRGTYVRVSVSQPSPILGVARFVADCNEPVRLSIVASSALTGKSNADGTPEYKHFQAEKTAFAELDYFKGHMLDGTRLVAEFACRTSQSPGRAQAIARELYESGGPADMKTVRCDMRQERGKEVVRGVPIRFSETEQVVAVNNQWLSASEITRDAIVFGSGASEWRVERQARLARLVSPKGDVQFFGNCTP